MPRDLVLSHNGHFVHIGDGHKTFIIAEIGQNHQGDFKMAKQLIKVAKESGADCVKFQKSCLNEKFTPAALNRNYDNPNSWGRTYGEHKEHLEFSDDQYFALNDYAQSIDIIFTASAMDATSLDLFPKFQAPFIKIGSGDTNNFPLIAKAASLSIPIFLSTGMQTLSTIQTAYDIITAQHKNLILMHCVSSYPTQPEDINMSLVHFYRERFPDVHLGYSGHEMGNVCNLAVAAGCKVVERHFTLNKTLKGSDHCCSLEPQEFAMMVNGIRQVEKVFGWKAVPEKRILDCELACRGKLGKSLVAARNLHQNQIIREEDVAVKVAHPNGISAERIREVIGMQVGRDVQCDELFDFGSLNYSQQI